MAAQHGQYLEEKMENNEYELYRTVSIREKEELQRRLVKARCSYLEKWKKLSIFRRRDFGGAREVCVIYVNSNQREQANAVLEEFLNTRQTRKRRRRGSSRRAEGEMRPRRKTEPVAKENEAQTIAVEKVSPSSYDPYSAGGKTPEEVRQGKMAGSAYANTRRTYIPDNTQTEEEYFPGDAEEGAQDGYVLGDEYADLEYADEPEEAEYEEGAYEDAEFEDDYSDEEPYDDELYDDDFEDNDIYEDEPQYGERKVKLINEEDSDEGYFLDDGPRLRGSTRVRGGEGSNPNDDFIDDFNFD